MYDLENNKLTKISLLFKVSREYFKKVVLTFQKIRLSALQFSWFLGNSLSLSTFLHVPLKLVYKSKHPSS